MFNIERYRGAPSRAPMPQFMLSPEDLGMQTKTVGRLVTVAKNSLTEVGETRVLNMRELDSANFRTQMNYDSRKKYSFTTKRIGGGMVDVTVLRVK